ncbi:diaminobutyrate--2-oxoglutarate transaminase, partial [Acinetobacter baumannii]|nr:diaminobutyrate--2-oxoglutarate transaminase [Acinetobacter baumannii]
MPIQFLTPIIQPAFNRNAGCGSDMMTDKVRIDTLRADLLDANNETFLARQA